MGFPMPHWLHRIDAAHSKSSFSIFSFLCFTESQVFIIVLVHSAQTCASSDSTFVFRAVLWCSWSHSSEVFSHLLYPSPLGEGATIHIFMMTTWDQKARSEKEHKVSDAVGKLGFFQQLPSTLTRRPVPLFLQSPAHSSHTPASAEKHSEDRQAALLPASPDSLLEGHGKYWALVEKHIMWLVWEKTIWERHKQK